ncbi:hypothetical protein JCM19232_873 [Vibrio ishigakensis]|uniref:Uncharacterized protein n=1 Tax=Vibrio ishigakensis TaxID=1481914 RepID=A0A0B8P182_9VIBR|nr:hypothetical protein JCM19232_873 [Vibrio ishigakensis]
MSCCNKPPNGETENPKLLLQVTLGIFAAIFLIAYFFG